MTLSIEGLRSWLAKRERALEARARLATAERALTQAEADSASSRQRLTRSLEAAGISFLDVDDIGELIASGQSALDRNVADQALRAALSDRRRELASRVARLDAANGAAEDWSVAWRSVCDACWIGEQGGPPSVGEVDETMLALAELGADLERRADLTDRIAKMERDRALFGDEVAELASAIGTIRDDGAALERCQAIIDAVQGAVRTAERCEKVEIRLGSEREKARVVADELTQVEAQIAEMTHLYGVSSLGELDAGLRASARRTDLQTRLSEVREEIVDAMRAATIEEAVAVLDGADLAQLELEIAERKARFEEEDGRSRELFAVRNKADDKIAAVGGDEAVAVIEAERKTVMLLIEEKAIAHLKLRLGATAANRALHAYRDRHRSSMMQRASESFALISRGAYTNLVSQRYGDNEVLIATGSDGSSKVASELSKGTRFQLYLALRVAGYHEFAAARSPGPFLADDIMETFDDFRAEEAFRLLAGMAGTGQVVYFTHHRHLYEIAKAVEPAIMVHDLQTGQRI